MIETQDKGDGFPAGDAGAAGLVDRVTAAAVAAIRDVEPAIAAAGPKLHVVTVEVELGTKGQLVGAAAWTQLRVNVSRLLGVKG